MARTFGVSLKQVMDAGEWLSKAVFNYIQDNELDAEAVLAAALVLLKSP